MWPFICFEIVFLNKSLNSNDERQPYFDDVLVLSRYTHCHFLNEHVLSNLKMDKKTGDLLMWIFHLNVKCPSISIPCLFHLIHNKLNDLNEKSNSSFAIICGMKSCIDGRFYWIWEFFANFPIDNTHHISRTQFLTATCLVIIKTGYPFPFQKNIQIISLIKQFSPF